MLKLGSDGRPFRRQRAAHDGRLALLLVLLGGQGQVGRRRRVAESPVLRETRDGAERLAALAALDLHAAVGVHPLVAAQVRKLGVGLQANLGVKSEWNR